MMFILVIHLLFVIIFRQDKKSNWKIVLKVYTAKYMNIIFFNCILQKRQMQIVRAVMRLQFLCLITETPQAT